ncbi:hypothetical protein Celaphus_00003968 [Cervus elaphus hippelaphus]|uniref:Uncharacterized protein n=1 Tax=Cervus elaphus hippelaphus TaxID=46360 RepID=A0A212DBX5_CEREH|nr:hypothetical protein Celaphus_00003968 [Cervus elaphus hippelaphus]
MEKDPPNFPKDPMDCSSYGDLHNLSTNLPFFSNSEISGECSGQRSPAPGYGGRESQASSGRKCKPRRARPARTQARQRLEALLTSRAAVAQV